MVLLKFPIFEKILNYLAFDSCSFLLFIFAFEYEQFLSQEISWKILNILFIIFSFIRYVIVYNGQLNKYSLMYIFGYSFLKFIIIIQHYYIKVEIYILSYRPTIRIFQSLCHILNWYIDIIMRHLRIKIRNYNYICFYIPYN